jgi:CDP-glucose 4,6-dehydratase
VGPGQRTLEALVMLAKREAGLDTPPFDGVFAGKRVLVTGHTGFKGSWLTCWLQRLGAQLCGYSDRVPTQPSVFEAAGIAQFIRDERGDVRDRERFARVVAEFRPDFVFHLAAQAIVSTSYVDPLGTFETNVMGTATVCDVLRELDRPCVAVIVTSDKAYENVEWDWGYRESDRLGGKDVYSGSKGAAELAFHAYHRSFLARMPDLRVASARAGNVIGGGDWAADRIVADCIRAWRDGGRVQIRSPAATRPWQHVLEPLSGYLALAQALADDATLDGESFNFGPRGEQNATVVELLRDLAQVWGFDTPDDSFVVVDNIPFHEAGLLKLNIDKALLRLRWTPNLFYAECVDLTGNWYRRVVRDGEDAHAVTREHIDRYLELARDRQLVWCS